uniref:Peptidase C1A papain C-terminal domain-containing protein n=1 Tax=Megaviridae environmental sample TaxID=1737588 RepID=A0A5J6VIW8_9VIRU|nr:MAG: hypothetical protein [Megaviridae environmental sample]
MNLKSCNYKMSNPLFSVIPSPPDERDWICDDILHIDELPLEFTVVNLLKPINQGPHGTCAAHTAACIKEQQEDIGRFSHHFIYNNRRNQSSSGMYGRDVMKILHKKGAIPQKDYSCVFESPDDILPEYYERALNFRIKHYARVYTINGLKKSLMTNGCCFIAFPCYNRGTRMWKDDGSEKLGGHAMTVIGWTKDGFIIRNSWGVRWGNKGNCLYSWDDWGAHYDIWSTIDDESYFSDEDLDDDEDNNRGDQNDAHKRNPMCCVIV